MIDFAPGMRTIIRDEEWMVKKIETNSLGNKTLYCVGISPLVKDREAIFLTDLEEIQIVDPAEVKLVADTSPFYKRALLYLESQWRQQIPTDANLHIGHKAAMDLMPYQLDPAKLALQRPRQRILIADTVGLGKTLEAGILMSELIARGKGKRILVVTVKSMMTQFQKEMWNRFTIPLVRLDSNRIQKIRANLPSNYNPFFYYDKTIVSIDTLKRDVEYRTHLENAYWDIIVIDEAQNVAERGDHQAQRSRLAKLLADRSDTMIMLSATPHDGRAKSFASLMNMLDPTAIADPQNYTPEDIKGLCIRRFKKDVKDQVSGSFLERKITLERCNASAKEEYAFDIFAEMQLEMDLGKTKGTGQLFKTSLEKSLFSSPAACIKSIEARLKKLYKKYTADDIKDIHLLENLKTALEAITPADFTRYQKLLDLIRSKEYAWNPADSGDRVVIFTERIETMKYLAERLRKDLGLKANAIQEISGGMSDAEQQRIVEDFGRTESPVRVLVASDVASEGLNLHYLSHRLIHFDIPWSLMVFQQRNGRIDRYGQQNRPDIRYMLIESDNKRIKGDMRIIEILITKEEQALKNIGDPSLLLGKFTIEDEELVVAETIESGSDSDAFEQTLDAGEDDFDPFEALMAAAGKEEDEDEKKSEIVSDETLFSDMDYLYQALTYLNQTENHSVERLKTVSGLDIRLTPDMERRLKALVPEEALPQGETLRVSDDKAFCMEQMRSSMQKNMDESAWPTTQYLWKLHPVLSWVNDKASLLFKRDEAPVLGIPGALKAGESIYVVTGSMPNLKSTPLVVEQISTPEKVALFALAKDDDLLRLGVPEVQLDLVRSFVNKEDFYKSESAMPHDVYEHLSWLVEGFPMEEVLELVSEEQNSSAFSEDLAAALDVPTTLKSFVVVDGEDELRRIMAEPLEKWRVFLHPTQRKIVQKEYSGSARVLGGAGTGKTVVAMHRAKHLASKCEGQQRILMTTFTANLAADIRENLRKICTLEELRRIEVIHLDAWVNQFLRESGFSAQIGYDDVINPLWERAVLLANIDLPYETTFYEEEWNRIVIAQEALTLEKYVKATRNGRGTRLDRKKRMQVWKVFENYQNLMKENQIRDINTAMYESTKLLQSAGRKPRYASIIIDEGQDFSDNAYRLIRALAGEEHPNDIFIVGDSHQRIYRNYPTLSKCGINVRGRSSILKINYRTTEEIRKHAFALLNGISFDDLDEDLDLGDKCQSLTHGEKPIVENFENANDEFDFLLREVKKLKENGVSLTDICVVARTKKLVDDYIALFTRAGIRSYAIKRNKVDDRSFDGLRVATMHRVKGLEFKYVFIAAVNNRIIPLPFAINKTDAVSEVESITSEKCLLYVAMTRAQKGVYITSYGRPSEFLV